MFEHLESIRDDLKPMFGQLRRLAPEVVEPMQKLYPQCPIEYWKFLMERGAGALEQDGQPFFFEDRLVSAEKDLYRDRQIYDNGAKGDVMIFGHESIGTAYGFDSGADWRLVEVDEFRIVTPLSLTFEQFIVGLVLCYPQIPISVEHDVWIDGVGTRYQLKE